MSNNNNMVLVHKNIKCTADTSISNGPNRSEADKYDKHVTTDG